MVTLKSCFIIMLQQVKILLARSCRTCKLNGWGKVSNINVKEKHVRLQSGYSLIEREAYALKQDSFQIPASLFTLNTLKCLYYWDPYRQYSYLGCQLSQYKWSSHLTVHFLMHHVLLQITPLITVYFT